MKTAQTEEIRIKALLEAWATNQGALDKRRTAH